MSSGKGSLQQGAPTTTVNPAQASQQPYLDYGYEQAKSLYQNQPQQAYPGQSYAPINPYTTQGYSDIYATGQSVDQNLRPVANQAWGNAASGNYQGNPAYGGYQGYAGGTSYPQGVHQAVGKAAVPTGNEYARQVGTYGQAAANTGGQYAGQTASYANPAAASGQFFSGQAGQYAPQQAAYAGQLGANRNLGLSQLGQTASGYYLPGQAGANPYLQPTIDAALDPLNRNYQTVVDPGNAAAASASGRYGSGAHAGQVGASQQNYLEQAGDITSKMSSDIYNAERARQDAAAQTYGSQYQAGLTGAITGLGEAGRTAVNAGNLANQGYQNAGNLLAQAGSTANAGYSTGANAANAAGGLSFKGLDTAGTAANNYAAQQQYGLNSLSNAFNTANTNQLRAAEMYPQLAAAQYSGSNAAVQAGQGHTAQQQADITGAMSDWQRNQQQPYANLNAYLASIGKPVGGSETVTKSAYTDPFSSALSGIGGLAGIAGSLGWAPLAGLAI